VVYDLFELEQLVRTFW